MSFNKYDTVEQLDDSKHEWFLRVRAQTIWKALSRESKDCRGYNVIFIDDCNARIHAFIAAQISAKYESILIEGAIYELNNFSVKYYNDDETNRAIRTDKHIYFTNDTQLIKASENGLKIEPHSFDLFFLDDVEKTKNDNRYLIDVVGVIQDAPVRSVYKKDDGDKSNVKFTIFDGRYFANVTFFNEFGDSFLKAMEDDVEEPVIITIAFAKIREWNDEVSLTNYPATRFYLNNQHHSVKQIRTRLSDKSFYVVELEDDAEQTIPCFTVKELLTLKADYSEKKVQCKLIVKRIDQKLKWFCNYCAKCEVDIHLVDEKYKCPVCGKIYPYPDKRYHLTTLCSDSTGTIPIIWKDEEVIRLCGKTVYDLIADEEEVGDGDKFPPVLKQFEKKQFNITIGLTEENLKEGSNVYTAMQISDPNEISGSHSPNDKMSMEIKPTEISNETNGNKNSPPTEKSTTKKTKARKSPDPVPWELEDIKESGKLPNIKNQRH